MACDLPLALTASPATKRGQFSCLSVPSVPLSGPCDHTCHDRSRQWEQIPLIPALRRQKQGDLCVQGQPGLESEFNYSQGYTKFNLQKYFPGAGEMAQLDALPEDQSSILSTLFWLLSSPEHT